MGTLNADLVGRVASEACPGLRDVRELALALGHFRL